MAWTESGPQIQALVEVDMSLRGISSMCLSSDCRYTTNVGENSKRWTPGQRSARSGLVLEGNGAIGGTNEDKARLEVLIAGRGPDRGRKLKLESNLPIVTMVLDRRCLLSSTLRESPLGFSCACDSTLEGQGVYCGLS